MVEAAVELVDGVGPEGVAHLGTVEGHSHRSSVDGTVVGNVGEVVEVLYRPPGFGVEEFGDHERTLQWAPVGRCC